MVTMNLDTASNTVFGVYLPITRISYTPLRELSPVYTVILGSLPPCWAKVKMPGS